MVVVFLLAFVIATRVHSLLCAAGSRPRLMRRCALRADLRLKAMRAFEPSPCAGVSIAPAPRPAMSPLISDAGLYEP